MEWQTIEQIIIKIAIGIGCALISGLVSWVLVKCKNLISSKVKDASTAALLNAALDAVETATKATQQTLVDNIKGTDRWDKDAQRAALDNAVAMAKAHCSESVKLYIAQQCGGDIDTWFEAKVEALLHDIKK